MIWLSPSFARHQDTIRDACPVHLLWYSFGKSILPIMKPSDEQVAVNPFSPLSICKLKVLFHALKAHL